MLKRGLLCAAILAASIYPALSSAQTCQAVSFPNVVFTSPSISGPQFHAGGTSQREGVGSVVAGGLNWIVASDRTISDGNGNFALRLFQNSTGIGYGISALNYIVDSSGNQLYAQSNPALTSDGQFLFLSWVTSNGILHWVKSQTTVNSGNIIWGAVNNFQAGLPFIYSPSLTTYTVNGAVQVVTSAITSDRTLWVGQFAASNPTPGSSLANYPQFNNIGMAPGLGSFNNTIYLGYPTNASNHALYYLTSSDGVNFNLSAAASNDASSTSAALQSFHNCLYMAFRTNDGDHKFIYKYSPDGSNWSNSASLSNVRMGGPPSLADGTTLVSDPNKLVGTIVANDSSYYLYGGESN